MSSLPKKPRTKDETMTPNVPIDGHPLVGTTHTFHDVPYAVTAKDDDTGPGVLLIGNGMAVRVRSVFRNWGGNEGSDILYVECPETGESTHVTPRDLNLTSV